MRTGRRLPLLIYLQAVDEHGLWAREHLMWKGYHPKTILKVAEKAAARELVDFRVAPDRATLGYGGFDFLKSAMRPERIHTRTV